MTITVDWVGSGRQFNSNLSDVITVVKYAGSGGTPAHDLADGALEGGDALTVRVNKQGVLMAVEVPSPLDFVGTHNGQLIYIWVNFLAASLLTPLASNGMGICLSTGTPTNSNYSLFTFYGSDNYDGGWRRLILNPTLPRSSGVGTLDIANITHIGVFADVGGATARFDNLVMDACDVGTGIKVTGTSTLDLFDELVNDEITNKFGVITSIGGSNKALEINGNIELGDAIGSTSTNVESTNAKLFYGEPKYYNGSTLTNSIPLDFFNIKSSESATNTTSIKFGEAVGSSFGRNGISIIGSDLYDINIDISNGSSVELFNTTFEDITGNITLSGSTVVSSSVTSSSNLILKSSVVNLTMVESGQIDLTSLNAQLSSCTIINPLPGLPAILTDDISKIGTISISTQSTGHAIQLTNPITSDTSVNWDITADGYATIDGNTGNEVLLVDVDDGVTLTINVSESGSIPSVNNIGLGVVDISVAPVVLTITNLVVGTEIRLVDTITRDIIGGVESSSDTFEYTYIYSPLSNPIDIIIHNTGYEYEIFTNLQLSNSNNSIPVNQRVDRWYTP